MKQLKTLGEGALFEYGGINGNQIKIQYGEDFKRPYDLDGTIYDRIIRSFKGKTVRIHLHATEDSLQKWIVRETGKDTRIAQYVAPILCWEKHAKPSDKKGRISFL